MKSTIKCGEDCRIKQVIVPKNIKVLLFVSGIFVAGFFIVLANQNNSINELVESSEKEDDKEWSLYQNDKYLFKVSYPDYLTNVESDTNSFRAYFPLYPGDSFSNKIFTIDVREEEYDQGTGDYCDQGLPHTSKVNLNGINFCEIRSNEDIENGMGVRYLSYFKIHNNKWISFNLRLSYCIDSDCTLPSEAEIEEEKEVLKKIVSTFSEEIIGLPETIEII